MGDQKLIPSSIYKSAAVRMKKKGVANAAIRNIRVGGLKRSGNNWGSTWAMDTIQIKCIPQPHTSTTNRYLDRPRSLMKSLSGAKIMANKSGSKNNCQCLIARINLKKATLCCLGGAKVLYASVTSRGEI